jgi:prepilin-type N-terminal cleavage/methylation domain-containing protein
VKTSRYGEVGFTLIEVMVALTVGALVLATARAILVALGDGAERMATASLELERKSNSERLMRSLTGRLVVGDGPDRFEGEPGRARFTSFCEVPEGWLERCTVEYSAESNAGSSCVVLSTLVGDEREQLTVLSGPDRAQLIYLSDARNGGTWLIRWGTSITAPLAIGIVSGPDTTVLRIGERG